jgi:hypothetical protein
LVKGDWLLFNGSSFWEIRPDEFFFCPFVLSQDSLAGIIHLEKK